MKRKIYLDGELGERYGKELTMNVSSFAEVFRCLEANYPDLREYLIDCHEKDIGFMCEVAGAPLTEEQELLLLYQEGDMYISPQPMGAKSGGMKILAAIAIVIITIVAIQVFGPEGGYAALEGFGLFAANASFYDSNKLGSNRYYAINGS